jgi:hypothetical protein
MSLQLLKYRLYGNGNDDEYDPKKRGFDVIINGHGVNDNNFDTQSRTQVEWGHLQEAIQVAEAFYRQARTSRECGDNPPPPLVLFLNEYLGNFNELIAGENLRHAAVQLVSEYYDFAYVSYSSVFARYVHRRSSETIFSPKWGTLQQPKQEVHFGMTGHVLISWVLAYSALQSMVDYCNHQQQHPLLLGEGKEWSLLDEYTNKETSGHNVRLIPDASKDEVLINSIPPLLDTAKWTTISETWEQDAVEYKRQVREYCALGDNITQSPCPFAFLSSTYRLFFTAVDEANTYLAPFIVNKASNTTTLPSVAATAAAGWQAVNDMRGTEGVRIGLVPMHGVGSNITYRVNNLRAPVRLVTIQYMKSYGPDWDASMAHFQLRVSDRRGNRTKFYETNFDLVGWHNQKTSIGYVHEIDLGKSTPAQVGTTIELEITLVKGIKFKINAIMMCVR